MSSLPWTSSLRALLRPLVRYCLRHSIKLQEVYAALKAEYVAEAGREILRSGQEVTSSKLSVMTGIPRKFINQVSTPTKAARSSNSLITTLLERWHSDAAYTTGKRRRPRSLSCEGNESEFASLVRSLSVDLNPYTVLFELERVGLVDRRGTCVIPRARLYVEKDIQEALEIAGADSDALIKAIEHNVSARGNEHLHLYTCYDNIPSDRLEEIRLWFLQQGSAFQAQAREYLSQFDRDASQQTLSTDGRNRVRVVLFEFSEETHD